MHSIGDYVKNPTVNYNETNILKRTSLEAQIVKNLPAIWQTSVQSLG